MNIKEFYNLAKNHFSFKLTAKQDLTLYKLSEFILNDDDNSLFILKGMLELEKLLYFLQ